MGISVIFYTALMGDDVGMRLLHARTGRGLTQRQLAAPRYTAAYVSAVELGRRQPSSDALRFFADRLGMDLDELRTGTPPGRAAGLRLELAEARRLLAAGRRAEAEAGYHRVGDAARAGGHDELAGRALHGLGRCAHLAGDLDGAVRRYRQAEEAVAALPFPARVPALVGRAQCLHLTGRLRDAVFLLHGALDRLDRESLSDPDAALQLHSSLVGPYIDLGLLPDAAQAAERALALAPQVPDPEQVAAMHVSVARTYMAQARYADAERSLDRAYETYQQLDWATERAYCHWARGYMYSREGSLAAAATAFDAARAILVEVGAGFQLRRLDCELADVLRRQGDTDRAGALLAATLAGLDAGHDLLAIAGVHRQLGMIAVGTDRAVAEAHYRRAIDLLDRADSALELAATCRLLGDLLGDAGRVAEAAATYRRGLDAVQAASPPVLGTT